VFFIIFWVRDYWYIWVRKDRVLVREHWCKIHGKWYGMLCMVERVGPNFILL